VSALKATSTICFAEEIEARKIKCGVTFFDLDSWGISKALCIEDTCKGTGAIIYGGPSYAPNSSVCLAAEHAGQFSKIDEFKLVRISEQSVNQRWFGAKNQNDIDSVARM